MATTIIGRPYDSLTKNINPVYNGLGFIVDSNKKYNTNMKYICEIFIGNSTSGTKIGELRHNPDISNENRGVFDVGRIVEDYITYELTFDVTNLKEVNNAYKQYYCQFGEEYSRSLKISSVVSGGVGLTKLYTSHYTTARPGDRVYIQGASVASYNTYFTVMDASPSYITINKAYTPCDSTSMYLVQGIAASLVVYTGSDGLNYYKFTSSNKTINEGDIFVTDPSSIAPSLAFLQGSEWSITKKTQLTSTSYEYLTNIPFQVAILGQVSIIPKGNYVLKNLVSTVSDSSVAFNGVVQYEEFNDWTPNPYRFRIGDTSGRMLTTRPRKTINLCRDEYFTLSSFADKAAIAIRNNMPTQFAGYIAESYNPPTDTIPTPTTGGSAGIYNSTSSGTVGKLVMVLAGYKTADYTQGSYVNIVGKTTTGATVNLNNVRIAWVYFNPFVYKTYLTIDTAWSSTYSSAVTDWTIKTTIKVIIRSIGFNYLNTNQPIISTSYRIDVACGPKNLFNSGFTEYSTTAYKYFITPYGGKKAASGPELNYNGPYGLYSAMGETFTFEIGCDCTKFKKWTLVWMNELGGWDWFTFDKRSDKVRDIERSQFGRHLKSASNKYSYSVGQKGKSTYNTKSVESITIRSKFLSQEELDWLSYIYESPEVYIIDVTKNIYQSSAVPKALPVNVTDAQAILHNKINMGDKGTLYNYELTIQMANERVIQRGSNFGGYYYNRS